MSGLVLIADGNAQRGRRLLEACSAAGIPCKSAPHGAAALEVALSDQPGLVVAQIDLPLVDAVKLAEIMRANPRTHGAGFLFLGEEGRLQGRGRAGDVLLPGCAPPDEILGAISELIEKRRRIDRLDLEAESGGKVTGDLAQLPLGDLAQLFHEHRRSGRLELTRPSEEGGREHGRIDWLDGEVVHAETGLVEREKALFRLMTWRHGEFSFRPERVEPTPRILMPTRALLAEGLRQLQEWDRLALQLPPLDSRVHLTVQNSELPNIVHPLTQEVLLLLELYERVSDVVDHCAFPDYQVLRTLHTLAEREIIEIARARSESMDPSSDALFNPAQVRRLGDWLRESGSGRDAKLLVVSSEAAAALDFANLLSAAPGVRLSPELARGQFGEGDLAPLARVDADEFGIELLHMPLSDRLGPLWPLAGHSALGTLVLLQAPMRDALERVREISQSLRALPRSRTFHVILIQKGVRISPDELRENLSLIDEASLFLLPLDASKDPVAALRRLFARVIP